MSQSKITAFYNSRKRPANSDSISTKNKNANIDCPTDGKRKCGRRTPVLMPATAADLHVTLAQKSDQETLKVGLEIGCPKVATPQTTEAKHHVKDSAVFAKKSSANNATKTSANIAVKTQEPAKLDGSSLARKELSLGDIRKKLAGSSRLAEIKAAADRLSRNYQQHKESSSKNLKEFRSLDVELPTSPSKKAHIQDLLSPKKDDKTSSSALQPPLMSPRKVVVSPIKSPSKVPAYIRHASLVAKDTSLPLPHHYRFLGELFRGMEAVVSMLFNRNEKITFAKLKPSVQEMLKRNFTEKHLAQIKQLVPDFYNFEVQKVKNFSNSTHRESYELVVTPNFPIDIKVMNPTVLLERRRFFFTTLLQLAKKHHSQYLLALDPPMVISDDKLTRWHPEFELEKIPEVESAKLPEVPNVEKYSTAQDVLSKARELFKCNTKMERALEKLSQAKARGLTEQERAVTGIREQLPSTAGSSSQPTKPSTSDVQILNPALRNLPAGLLERVKAKQAAKALEAMTRTNEQDEKYLVYCRLPDLARTLRNIFVTERKNVIALSIVLSKLDSSFKSNVSANELQKDIKVLAETVPEFTKLSEARNALYLRLDKDADMKKVTVKLEALAEKYKAV